MTFRQCCHVEDLLLINRFKDVRVETFFIRFAYHQTVKIIGTKETVHTFSWTQSQNI